MTQSKTKGYQFSLEGADPRIALDLVERLVHNESANAGDVTWDFGPVFRARGIWLDPENGKYVDADVWINELPVSISGIFKDEKGEIAIILSVDSAHRVENDVERILYPAPGASIDVSFAVYNYRA